MDKYLNNSKNQASLLTVTVIALLGALLFAALTLSEFTRALGLAAEANRISRQLWAAWGVAALLAVLLGLLGFVIIRRLLAAPPVSTVSSEQTANLEKQLSDRNQQFRQLQTQLEVLLDSVQEGVLYTERHQVRYTNPALGRLTGYDGSEALNGHADPLVLYQSLSELIAQKGSGQSSLKIRRANGSELDANVISRRIDSTGGLLAVIRDSTEAKNLQAQKTRFVSNAAHELRTPIANLKTRLYLIRKQPEKLDEHLQVIELVVQKMQTLIEEMFDFSQLERGTVLLEREDVTLQALLHEIIEGFQTKAQRRSLTLTCKLPAEKLTVFVDPKRIQQVLTNLIYSAMNHTREGGFVSVELSADPPATSPRYATIQIRDNGVGIPQDLLDQVFQPFSLTKHGDISSGTAIGLTISREIVELHGGQIMVESEIGKGTLFTVRLALV